MVVARQVRTNAEAALQRLRRPHYARPKCTKPADFDVYLICVLAPEGGCSAKLLNGEPNLCLANKIEPYSYHIVNRWFDSFFLTGVALSNQSRGTDTPYKHLVQPWLASLFLDCENSGLLSWPGSGWRDADVPVLHCPNASTIAEVRAAFKRGDLLLHAFPHNAEPGAFPDASLFESALSKSGEFLFIKKEKVYALCTW